MSLKSQFIFWCSLLMGGVALFGSVTLWNHYTLRHALRAVQSEYTVVDHIDSAMVQVNWLRDALMGADGATYLDLRNFTAIQNEVSQIDIQVNQSTIHSDSDSVNEQNLNNLIAINLQQALAKLNSSANTTVAKAAAADLELLASNMLKLSRLAPSAARRHISIIDDLNSNRLFYTNWLLAILLILSALIHYRQYLLLVRPLEWLRDEMRRVAAKDYKELVRSRGANEFQSIAGAFNGLARELADVYRGMEEKIISRSRELVRSERLASVGFLAAGVAHEINNPLSIISGYAELAAKKLRRIMLGEDTSTHSSDAEAEAEALVGALEAQDLIRDEAFRCKEITNRLLSLARGSDEGRQVLSMDEVARQVTVLTKGLKNYRDRNVILEFKPTEILEVLANPSEMKQVLLNLTVNALEAVPDERGIVRIGGRRSGEWVELSIEDNGKGMTTETLQHVFEPFFTQKRGAGEAGTGLGLSITHAIVESHGGHIRAESSGLGKGSRFTLQLPARKNEKQLLNSAT